MNYKTIFQNINIIIEKYFQMKTLSSDLKNISWGVYNLYGQNMSQ